MAPLLLTGLDVLGWVAVGVPPKVPEGDPLSMLDGILVVWIVAISFYCSVRLVTWIHVKISSLQLFRDIRHELGIGGPRLRDRGRP